MRSTPSISRAVASVATRRSATRSYTSLLTMRPYNTATNSWTAYNDSQITRSALPSVRQLSTSPAVSFEDEGGPMGDLFQINKDIGPSLIGQTASIRRTFGPRANAQALLTCGGESLAAHASFDPDYLRAKDWIRSHAVGPAVLSPILISGLVGALVEAAFPFSVPDSQSMRQLRPLIVGASVNAKIEVQDVLRESGEGSMQEKGYQVCLITEVTRVRDDALIAEGSHTVWIPDYQKM